MIKKKDLLEKIGFLEERSRDVNVLRNNQITSLRNQTAEMRNQIEDLQKDKMFKKFVERKSYQTDPDPELYSNVEVLTAILDHLGVKLVEKEATASVILKSVPIIKAEDLEEEREGYQHWVCRCGAGLKAPVEHEKAYCNRCGQKMYLDKA